jgi:hypothetical protein
MLIASTLLFSCVSTNIPKSEKKARRRLAKHLKGVGNILQLYPHLSDTLTTVKYDTLILKEHTADTSFIALHDTTVIDNLLIDFANLESNNLRSARTTERVRTIRNLIIKEVLKDTTFFYQDSLVYSTFIIRDGKYYYKSTVKEQKKAYKTEIINRLDVDCDTTKDFWKDYKFWLLLLILLILGIIRNKNNEKK